MRQAVLFSLWLAGMTLACGTVRADSDALAELYGQGYHAFFEHDLMAAEGSFSAAITEGTKDPRVFYYRGLTYLCQGRQLEADADFRQGATLEAEGYGRLIGRGLDRIQGPARLRLERARAAARLDLARQKGFSQPAPSPPRQLPPMPAAPRPAPPSPAPGVPAPPSQDPFADRSDEAVAPEPAPFDEAPMPEAEMGDEAAEPPAEETDPFAPSDDAPAAPAPDDPFSGL